MWDNKTILKIWNSTESVILLKYINKKSKIYDPLREKKEWTIWKEQKKIFLFAIN